MPTTTANYTNQSAQTNHLTTDAIPQTMTPPQPTTAYATCPTCGSQVIARARKSISGSVAFFPTHHKNQNGTFCTGHLSQVTPDTSLQPPKQRGRQPLDTFQRANQARIDRVFAEICSYKQQHDGNSPTIRYLADTCDIPSTSIVYKILIALHEQNLIVLSHDKYSPRSIQVVGAHWIAPNGQVSA